MLNQELFLESTGYVTQKELPAPKQCSCLNPIRGGLNVIFKSLQWINQWGGVALSRKLECFSQSHFILSSYRDTRKTLNKSGWVTPTGGGFISVGFVCCCGDFVWLHCHFCQDPAIIRLNESRQSISGHLSPPSPNIRSQIVQSWLNLI